MSRLRLSAAAILAASTLLASCGSDPLAIVGGSCKSDRDCEVPLVCARASSTCQWSELGADAAAAADAGNTATPDPVEPKPDASAAPSLDTAAAAVDASVALPDAAAAPADVALAADQAIAVDVAEPADREPRDNGPPVKEPGDVRGQVFWFDAAQGVSLGADDRVAIWQERSSAAFQARPVKVGPRLLADAGNGHPAVSFGPVGNDTVLLRIPDHRALNWNRDDFTVVAVLKHRNRSAAAAELTSYGMIYSKVLSEVPPYVGVQLYANDPWPSYLGQGPTRTGFRLQVAAYGDQGVATNIDGYNDDRVRLVVAMRRKKAFLLRVDGVEVGASTAPDIMDVDNPGIGAVMGANPTRHAQQLDGELFELVGYRGPMPDDDLVALERSLLMKYQLAEFANRDQ
jgi:hypothetical protein